MTEVVVTPLQPPFDGDVVFFDFPNLPSLALSREDADKIQAMLGGGDPVGREIVVYAEGDRLHISVLQ